MERRIITEAFWSLRNKTTSWSVEAAQLHSPIFSDCSNDWLLHSGRQVISKNFLLLKLGYLQWMFLFQRTIFQRTEKREAKRCMSLTELKFFFCSMNGIDQLENVQVIMNLISSWYIQHKRKLRWQQNLFR